MKIHNPHILVIPYPAQGHVIPLMELSQCLVKHGFKITFVNTDYYHQRVLNALTDDDNIIDHINLVSIPDGLERGEDRNQFAKLTESLSTVASQKLKELIEGINESEDGEISCIIADQFLGWPLEVAMKMNIRCAALWPASAAMLAQSFSVDKLIQDGIIDKYGKPLMNHKIRLAPTMPAMNTENLLWLSLGDDELSKRVFFDVINKNSKISKHIDWIVCNSAHDFEPGAFALYPNILPIGPLIASTRRGSPAGCFWKEDANCLKWLDQHQRNSVIYVAFGSITMFDNTQFRELAMGLELTKKPFLWVVRPGTTKETLVYLEGFEERIANRGKIVEWASQQKVLSHPSVGCFLSHCGWNSTMEGVANGVPFLCWPYFGDQFLNETYICDEWKVGLNFDRDENGIINREEIKNKVDRVMSDEKIRERAKQLKEIAMTSIGENGHSNKILSNFVEWLDDLSV